VRGIADHGLIEIPDLHPDMTLRIGKRAGITDVTVSAGERVAHQLV
jgi:hypothetical protein